MKVTDVGRAYYLAEVADAIYEAERTAERLQAAAQMLGRLGGLEALTDELSGLPHPLWAEALRAEIERRS